MMLYALMLAALVKAVVVSRPPSQTTSSIETPSKRSIAVHNYALVCAYDRAATNFCQQRLGYGCDSNGKKRYTHFDNDCDVVCTCVDLFPKSRCLVGITGQSYCFRSVDQDELVQGVVDTEEEPPTVLAARSDVNGMLEPSEDVAVVPSIPLQSHFADQTKLNLLYLTSTADVLLPQSPKPSTGLHHRHTVCTTQHFLDNDCPGSRHLRNSADSVGADDPLDHSCTCVNSCLDLLSKVRCSINEWKIVDCAKDEEVTEIINPELLESIQPNRRLTSRRTPRHRPPHNYAMVCASDRQETEYCQNDGYYCDSHGKIGLRSPAVSNKYCNDNCKCVDVSTRTYYMTDDTGAMYLLSSETIREALSLEQLADILAPSGGIEGLADKNTKQSKGSHTVSNAFVQHIITTASPHPYGDDDVQDRDFDSSSDAAYAEWPGHDMAVVCGADRHLTSFCQSDHGYFSSSAEMLIQKAD